MNGLAVASDGCQEQLTKHNKTHLNPKCSPSPGTDRQLVTVKKKQTNNLSKPTLTESTKITNFKNVKDLFKKTLR